MTVEPAAHDPRREEYKITGRYLLWTLLVLSLGLVIYLSVRPDTRLTVFVTHRLGIRLPGAIAEQLPAPVLGFLRGYAGDMLWAAGLTLSVSLVMRGIKGSTVITCLICLGFISLLEFMQKLGIISGTYDIWDIILESVVSVCIALAIKFRKEDVK